MLWCISGFLRHQSALFLSEREVMCDVAQGHIILFTCSWLDRWRNTKVYFNYTKEDEGSMKAVYLICSRIFYFFTSLYVYTELSRQVPFSPFWRNAVFPNPVLGEPQMVHTFGLSHRPTHSCREFGILDWLGFGRKKNVDCLEVSEDRAGDPWCNAMSEDPNVGGTRTVSKSATRRQ